MAGTVIDLGAFRCPDFYVRLAELAFGIVAFACIAEANGYSRVNYAIWCGVSTTVLCLALMAGYLTNGRWARGAIPLVLDLIWCIFWLACACTLSVSLSDVHSLPGQDALCGSVGLLCGPEVQDAISAALPPLASYKSRLQASVAFSWVTWFVFCASIAMDVADMRHHRGVSVSFRTRNKVPAGGAPTGAAVSTV